MAAYTGPTPASARAAGTTTADGVKATVSLKHDGDPVGNRTIVHPLQWVSSELDNPDFLGFGTYRGAGTDGGRLYNCVDYYGSNWRTYFDGVSFGTYFCRTQYPTLGDTESGNTFKIIYNYGGSGCDQNYFCAVLNGDAFDQQRVDTYNTTDGRLAAGGEVVGDINYQNQVHYYDVQKHKASNGWTKWGSGTTLCDNPYTVRVTEQYNFWPEKP